jgi:acyl transferase domain-containing protein/SAM-dependent methyltransferase
MSEDSQSTIKRALQELRTLRAKLEVAEGAQRAPIAVVGMGLRLPGGVVDAESFADLLWGEVDAVGDIPASRWSLDDFFAEDPDAPAKMNTRFGAFVDGVDLFDPAFFGISPREAASMDPQQRLLLELAWESLENGAIAPDALKGRQVGVYVGVGNVDYARAIFPRHDLIDPYFATGTSTSIAAGRIAYTLGLIGPAVSVDTACSSGLSALHLACQALRLGECDAALAGGVNLILTPELNVSFTKGRMMAADGRCKTFDAAADGYVRGEGGVVLALKREADARADGDRILAVIRGSAINQDGRSNGITAPNGPAQEAVIRAALVNAGAVPEDVGYVEAHGTGTPLGDPIEIGALQAVFAANRAADGPLLVGSVKTNIGHTEAAAGLAGVAKVILALQRREIPKNLHFARGNPHIDWDDGRVEVVSASRDFPQNAKGRLLAGVSAFGFSGTNAHVVIEEADAPTSAAGLERPAHILTLSAQTDGALRDLAGRWASRFGAGETVADLCFTANIGRAQLDRRAAVIGRSTEDFVRGLNAIQNGKAAPGALTGLRPADGGPRVAFLFTGQGSHFPGMGRELYETSPIFRKALDACAKAAAPYLERDLLEAMFSPDARALEDPVLIQPAGFALQIGLLALWRSWGVEPIAALGHSLGEYAAAYAAGVFSLEDAMRAVVARGQGAARCAGQGGMVAVSAPRSVIERGIARSGDLEIAGFNGPEDFVVSGTPQAVAELAEFVVAEGGRAKVLNVPFGSHSRWVEPALDTLAAGLENVTFHPSRLAMATNVTGAMAEPDEMSNADYWLSQMRRPVRFVEGLEAIAALGITHYVEIGSHPALCAAGLECIGDGPAWLASMRREGSAWTELLESAQRLSVDGLALNWRGFDAGYARSKLAGPTYPFQRTRHWIDAAPTASGASALQAWRRVGVAAEQQSQLGPLSMEAGSYPAKWDALERLTIGVIVSILRGAGLFLAAETHSFDEIMARIGAKPGFADLIMRWLERLTGAGLLGRSAEDFSAAAGLPAPDMAALWGEAEARFSDNIEMFTYIRHCGSMVLDVVTGQESPLETLFPGGSFAMAEDLYERSATMLYINALAGAAASAFAAAAPSGRPLRVLEIGGGTGATTASILPAVSGRDYIYRFTDVSDLFLDRARDKFKAYAGVQYGQFDFDLELEDQGYGAGQFDLIVSANAVHACTDLGVTLSRLKRLLAPGGVLALIESTTPFAWFDFTTGLIEGWRKHTDNIRTDGPLVQPEVWERAMKAAGFEDVDFKPRRGTSGDSFGQHLVLARAPGEFSAWVAAPDSTEIDATERSQEESAAEFQIDELLAAPAGERLDLMRRFVRSQVMLVLRSDPASPPDRDSRLTDLGLDSLMAVQLRNRLSRGLGFDKPLSATVMFDHPTIEALSNKMLSIVAPIEPKPAVSKIARPKAGSSVAVGDIAQMSDAEIEALLSSREAGEA